MTAQATAKKNPLRQVRDSVESVYIAIVLAFVLRAFMIEAFVIPTGSMANSLYGEHFSLVCPCCGYPYALGQESYQDGSRQVHKYSQPVGAQCPNCGYPYLSGVRSGPVVEPRGGDRVLVLKYLYDFAPLKPWDVVVFKNPQSNRENYIKRLIGLPGECIEIVHGDIFVSRDRGKNWRIRRKPHDAQKAMWQIVHDVDYPPDRELARAEGTNPPRWSPDATEGPWDVTRYDGRVFAFAGGRSTAGLTFQPGFAHFLPVNGYNSRRSQQNAGLDSDTDLCTDWKLSCVWMVSDTDDAPAQLDLVFESFGDRFWAEFHRDGLVRLLHQRRDAPPDDWREWGRTRLAPCQAGQGRRLALSNVDYRATVWVDGRPVLESTDAQYAAAAPNDARDPAERIYRLACRRATIARRLRENLRMIESHEGKLRVLPRRSRGWAERRTALEEAKQQRRRLEQLWEWFRHPGVSMQARGGACEVWHVKLQRDVFYTSPPWRDPNPSQGAQFDYGFRLQTHESGPNRWVRDEDGAYQTWGALGNPMYLRDEPGRNDLDEFFCLGDNSSQSHDGRSWTAAAPSLRLYDETHQPQYQLGTVPRYNMLGRAMLVYWPAGFSVPILKFPIVPNVGRMRLIR